MTAIIEFEMHMREAVRGQPLHRTVLGQDEVLPVMHGLNAQTLELAPQLVKARQMEIAQRMSQQPVMAPSLNLGAGAQGGLTMQNFSPSPPSDKG